MVALLWNPESQNTPWSVEYSLLCQWVQGRSVPSKTLMFLRDLVLYLLLSDQLHVSKLFDVYN